MKHQKAFCELKEHQKRRRLEAQLTSEKRDEVASAGCVECSDPHENVSDSQEAIDNSDTSSSGRLSVAQRDLYSPDVSESITSKSDHSSTEGNLFEVECVLSDTTQTGKCENLCSLKLKRCLQEWAEDEESIPNDCINRLLQKLHKEFPQLPEADPVARCKKESYTLEGYPSSATEGDAMHSSSTQPLSVQVSSLLKSCPPSPSSRSEFTSGNVKDVLHKVASKLDQLDELQCGIKRISDQQQALEKLLHKKFKKLDYRSSALQGKLQIPESAQSTYEDKTLPGPAKTMDELDVLVQQPGLPKALEGLVRVSVSESMRRILKRLLTRDLAMQFSFSGLGHRRQQSKIAFKDHNAMRTIYEVLEARGFDDAKEIVIATQRGLRGAADWDGNRPHRRTFAMEAEMIATTPTTPPTTVSTDPLPGPSTSS